MSSARMPSSRTRESRKTTRAERPKVKPRPPTSLQTVRSMPLDSRVAGGSPSADGGRKVESGAKLASLKEKDTKEKGQRDAKRKENLSYSSKRDERPSADAKDVGDAKGNEESPCRLETTSGVERSPEEAKDMGDANWNKDLSYILKSTNGEDRSLGEAKDVGDAEGYEDSPYSLNTTFYKNRPLEEEEGEVRLSNPATAKMLPISPSRTESNWGDTSSFVMKKSGGKCNNDKKLNNALDYVLKVNTESLLASNPEILDGTKAGPVLVAINPFKEVHLYGNEYIEAYKRKSINSPHVYAIADTAIREMIRDDINQSIVISGESGAGKTETAKIAMQYLAALGGGSGIEYEILQTNPILEAFGNARTLRNDNSSRFLCAGAPRSLRGAQTVSKLIGCTVSELNLALSTRKMKVGNDNIVQKLTLAQAIDTRDALAKSLYASLFEWLVGQINKSLGIGKRHTGRSISILDIYGFESFDKNSFEQFCINYANERLQQHFNRHLFKLEQEEYVQDGIDWAKVDFDDNQDCLNLFEKGQLFQLMQRLGNTTPHFIRCIKPNNSQLPETYEQGLILQQLRCCGVLEVVRISRSGYPTRMSHQKFAKRYGFLLENVASQDPLSVSVAILQQFNIIPEMYQIGYTKLFFRTGQLFGVRRRDVCPQGEEPEETLAKSSVLAELERRALKAEAALRDKEEENNILHQRLQQYESRWSEYEQKMESMEEVWQKQMASLQSSLSVAKNSFAIDDIERHSVASLDQSWSSTDPIRAKGWENGKRSVSRAINRDMNSGLSVISRLSEEFEQRTQVFADDAKFLMEVKSGKSEVSLNPERELRRLKQDFELWKKDFSSRLREAKMGINKLGTDDAGSDKGKRKWWYRRGKAHMQAALSFRDYLVRHSNQASFGRR
ncbi:myosin-2 heavy chain, non muscle [Musa troglodytarum]|uniref:Myosin-2 heavy chain, non muscle n=1 Tax=Musa troglodytarum TaxID=320322 RepID=A0A9E7F7K0_9LILI|nr:myosin-2 heavy chain, non muscle [Musa troglodytarum]